MSVKRSGKTGTTCDEEKNCVAGPTQVFLFLFPQGAFVFPFMDDSESPPLGVKELKESCQFVGIGM